ncbi:hypothetical protein DEJ50_03795 [Streptomyces venezuelae]|uniref:Uncharacterized protein n=1 Tax=Streptomyces venezuelae TaxID=54571 RepID=A0A5P2CZB0_STRVZ|nr:hypothetical protein DEJ50_03795 [Streptomyces venezuelae]
MTLTAELSAVTTSTFPPFVLMRREVTWSSTWYCDSSTVVLALQAVSAVPARATDTAARRRRPGLSLARFEYMVVSSGLIERQGRGW